MWEAADEGRLLVTKCGHCQALSWYPRSICVACSRLNTGWLEVSGHATVYSYTVVRRGHGAYKDAAPYVVAYVQLREGPRMLTNIVNCEPADVTIGLDVKVVFQRGGGGDALPRFEPHRSTQ